jgi:hypothetical protein
MGGHIGFKQKLRKDMDEKVRMAAGSQQQAVHIFSIWVPIWPNKQLPHAKNECRRLGLPLITMRG